LISKINVKEDGENWQEAYKWLAEEITIFKKVFGKYIK